MVRVVLVSLAVALSACSTTQQAAPVGKARSGLVDYSLFSPGAEGQAALRYVNPSAQWSRYKKIMILPVTFWAGDKSMPGEDQQALCDYFYQSLHQQMSQKFQVVDKPGPDVMKLAVAIVDASAATPVLRSISMLIPQARAIATLKYIGTGSYPFVGGLQAEAKLTNSHTGDVLGEWVDRRIGGGSAQNAAQWQWGDAENAINAWSAQSATKLASWTSGTATP